MSTKLPKISKIQCLQTIKMHKKSKMPEEKSSRYHLSQAELIYMNADGLWNSLIYSQNHRTHISNL